MFTDPCTIHASKGAIGAQVQLASRRILRRVNTRPFPILAVTNSALDAQVCLTCRRISTIVALFGFLVGPPFLAG